MTDEFCDSPDCNSAAGWESVHLHVICTNWACISLNQHLMSILPLGAFLHHSWCALEAVTSREWIILNRPNTPRYHIPADPSIACAHHR